MVMATMVLVQTVSSSSRLLTFQGLYDDVANGLMTGQYDFSNTIPITTTTTTTSSVGLSSTPHHHDPHSSHHAHGNEWFLTTLLPGAGRRGADDGAISCDVVQERVQSGQWEDPNHGQLFLRQVITKPSFYISVHNQEYDRIRYNSIFETGDYYEVEVRERFEYILGENQKDWDYHHSKFNHQRMPLVVDIGGNIGYYTLLSAAWKHAVVTFEINPTNILRLCESLSYGGQESHAVSIHRQGVSNVTGATVQVTLTSNPGATGLVPNKKFKPMSTNLTHQTEFPVSTITLDDFAQQNRWFEQKPQIHVSLLKLDTEGHEPQILQGAQQFIQQKLARNILVEFRPSCHEAMIALLDAGYAIVDDSKPRKRLMPRKEAITFLEEEAERVRVKKSWEYSDLWLRLETLRF
jgi:FkbM family methyltransferase